MAIVLCSALVLQIGFLAIIAPVQAYPVVGSSPTESTTLSAWKNSSSFGIENSHIRLVGDYSHYAACANPVPTWWEDLIFKDTGTDWRDQWGNNLAAGSTLCVADSGSLSLTPVSDASTASMIFNFTANGGTLRYDVVYTLADSSYIRVDVFITNEGESAVPLDGSRLMEVHTAIAGDFYNDWWYVPGIGQGSFTGTGESHDYTATAPWIAAWDKSKDEGLGIVVTSGLDLAVDRAGIYDWYGVCACSEGYYFSKGPSSLEPRQTFAYTGYYYLYQGTSQDLVSNFYHAVVGPTVSSPQQSTHTSPSTLATGSYAGSSTNLASTTTATVGSQNMIVTSTNTSNFSILIGVAIALVVSITLVIPRLRTTKKERRIPRLSDISAENLRTGFEFSPDTSPNDSMRVLESIRGGEGRIFVCANRRGDKLALKTFSYIEDPVDYRRIEKRFYNEAALWVGLGRHPNIVRALSFGKMSDSPYLLLEFVEGGNLRRLIIDKRLDIRRAMQIAKDVCSGLMYAHSQGVIHGDIKPENILLDEYGRAKVTDFGVSRISGAGTKDRTLSLQAMGTLSYMSPEQFFSERETDERSDIYSFGIVLYEMLTQKNPLRSHTLNEAVALRERSQLAPPSNLQKEIPREIDRLVLACTRRNPGDRLRHFGEVLAILEKYVDLNTEAH
jgi:hypothetical protein